MSDSKQKPGILPQRLCSEIQLFDLCDLESCRQKNGRFCTDHVLLSRFEKIAEEELRVPDRYISEVVDDAADEDDVVYNDDKDDGFSVDDLEGGEDSGWEDEE